MKNKRALSLKAQMSVSEVSALDQHSSTINQIQFFDQQLKQEQELLNQFKIMNWNNHKFSYIPLETSHLTSLFTDNNQQFQFCLSLLKKYNQEVEDCKQKSKEIQNGPWKNKFYGILQNLLQEVINTKNDRQLQNNFINKVQEWVIQQLETNRDPRKALNSQDKFDKMLANQSQQTLPTQVSEKSGIFPIINRTSTVQSQTNLSFQQDDTDLNQTQKTVPNDLNLPSQQIRQKLIDYKERSRTQHDDLNPPDARLKNFKRKQLQFDNPGKIMDKILNKSMESLQSEMSKPIKYPKPTGFLPNQDNQLKSQTQENEENPQEEQEQDAGDILDGMDNEEEDEKNETGAQFTGNKMIPDKKLFVDDNIQFKNPSKRIEHRSTFVNYVPSDEIYERKMEQKWLLNRQKEVQEKRADQEIIQIMNEFRLAKSKINQEINNKNERQTYGQQYAQIQYQPKKYSQNQLKKITKKIVDNTIEESDTMISSKDQITQQMEEIQKNRRKHNNSVHLMQDIRDIQRPKQLLDFSKQEIQIETKQQITEDDEIFDKQNNELLTHNLEYNIAKNKIKNVKNKYANLLNIQKNQDALQIMPSLSVYQQNDFQKQRRAFSTVFDRENPQKVKNDQLEEIEEVKKRMAKYKINIPIKTLMDSMLVPEGHTDSKIQNLPEPGQGLLENPFFEMAKKKKKKKK